MKFPKQLYSSIFQDVLTYEQPLVLPQLRHL